MESVLQYHIPELHPFVVHFPVALLIAALIPAVAWLWRGTRYWRNVTWLLVAMGTAGAFAAYYTGEPMEEQAEGVPIVDELVGLHMDMATYTLAAACTATLLLLAGAWWSRRQGYRRDPVVIRFTIALIVAVAAGLVAWTAHIGGTMVWGVAG